MTECCQHTWMCLDASSQVVHVGIIRDDRWECLIRSRDESINAIFASAASSLEQSGRKLREIAGFIFCEGPGSVLGIRLTAMAINTWRGLPAITKPPVFAYGSLQTAAAILAGKGVAPPFNLVSDFRKNAWNLYSLPTCGPPPPIATAGMSELEALPGPIYYIPTRSFGGNPPNGAHPLEYDLEDFPSVARSAGLLRPVERADARQTNPPTYQKWQGQRHRKI